MTHRYILKLIAAVSLFLAAYLPAAAAEASADPAATVAEADSAYRRGDFTYAAELYSKVAEEGSGGAPLLYNLGNAYWRDGDAGRAVLAYSRALRLDPGNERIKGNLDFVASKVTDSNKAELGSKKGNVLPDEPTFFQNLRNSIAADHRSNSWAILAVMAFLITVTALALYIFSPAVTVRKFGFFGSIICLFFTLIFIWFAFMASAEARRDDRGVVTAYKVNLLSEPSADSPASSPTLHRGTRLEVIDREVKPGGERWYKVRLNSDHAGWVRPADLEII